MHTYQLNGGQIVSEAWGNNLIVYLYDASGAPIGMMYRTTSYDITDWDVFWFEKNLLGDIVAIYNSTGTKVATYTYSDAWGNHSVTYSNGGASTGARYNPFRYRGYYYDTDLGMYYLQSRYYDSNTCRFINADGYISTGQGILGYNMFAYCGNNPVMYTDASGNIRSHVVVCSMDDVGSAATRYSSSIGNVLVIYGNSFSEDTKQWYANAYPNSIIVFDGRYCSADCIKCNPNMQIYNSYTIFSEAQQREILEILVKHDEAYPSRHTWGRTVESMLIEWDMHNDHYNNFAWHVFDFIFRAETCKSAMHVDFDSDSEGLSKFGLYLKALLN